MADPIKEVTLPSGEVRYRFVVDLPPAADGKRRQRRMSFRTYKEAEAERERLRVGIKDRTIIIPGKTTLNQYFDYWLQNYRSTRRSTTPRANTRLSYSYGLAPWRKYLGRMRLQAIQTEHIEDALTAMLKDRGNETDPDKGTASSLVSLQLIKTILDRAVLERKIPYNPAAPVRPAPYIRRKRPVWNDDQARSFLRYADDDRLAVAWHLTMTGLRRGEVLGLMWDDVDLATGMLTVRRSRVQAGREIRTEAPKSDQGFRTLPMTATLMQRLQEFRMRQQMEATDAGPAYTSSGFVVTDELGAPLSPAWYSKEWRRMTGAAGLPGIRLHDARHSANSLMAGAGIPDHVRAGWLGHTVQVNVATYTHVRPADLVAARDALNMAL
jgi:integrase